MLYQYPLPTPAALESSKLLNPVTGDAAVECDHAQFRRAFFSGASVLMVLHLLDFFNNTLMAAVWLAKALSASLLEKMPVAKVLPSLDAIKIAVQVQTGGRNLTPAVQGWYRLPSQR